MGKEKKEIGKLLELLNEYSKNIGYFNEEDLQGQTKAWILSKEFGWLKWLVENDKIEREKFGNSETKSSKYSDFELSYNTPREDYTNMLLMELAIQDEPILFLIGMLR